MRFSDFSSFANLRGAILAFCGLAIVALGSVPLASVAQAQTAPPAALQQPWAQVLAQARGGRVHFHAWGGDPRINAYLQWVSAEVERQFGISLVHIKLEDTATAVSQVLAEKTTGKDQDGAVGLIWINGENFRAMKDNDLLWGPFAESLPAWRYVDASRTPGVALDFSAPTDGFESPWGSSHFNFLFDGARVASLPRTPEDFLAAAQAASGRMTYPAPPDFYGTSFLKQALLVLAPDPSVFAHPAPSDPEAFHTATAPLWAWLEQLHPHLWRDGTDFPASGQAQLSLMNDGEIWNGVSFSLLEAAAKVADGLLPPTTKTTTAQGGALANVHFVAIPYNAENPAASAVVADFLLSPAAQLRKQDIQFWGDATVLTLDRLDAATAAAFKALPGGEAEVRRTLSEPHASWTAALEAAWLARYAR